MLISTMPTHFLCLQGLEMQCCTQQLDDLQCSLKSRELACSDQCSNDEVMCGICMEQPECIQLVECQHNLCQRCARQLLMVAAPSSCQCPFCRTFIAGFRGMPCVEEDQE
jgi:Zinc finger, C3HC4 type (RING finger)